MAAQATADLDGRWRRFDSSRIDIRQRTSAWEKLTRDLLLPLRLDAPAGPILGTIAGRRAGPVRQLALTASAHFGVRTTALAAGVGSDQCSIAFATTGRVEVRQYGRRVVLRPGQCAVYDTSDAFAVGSPSPFGATIVMFPNDLLGLPHGRLAQIAARPIEGEVASRIRRAVAEWAKQPHQDPVEVTDLIASVGSRRATGTAVPLTDDAIALAARRVVDTRLADPRLGPDFVAALLGVSRRRLYYACEQRIGPFAGYIRTQRLRHAAQLLHNPAAAGLPITEVALRSGFTDLAHFSRLFTRTYGMPASEWRAANRVTGEGC